jgi:hypothetical protein
LRHDRARSIAGFHEEQKPFRFEQSGHHLFCRQCGVRPFSRGYVEQIGGDFVSVQLGTLDDVTPAELVAAPVKYSNGRDNRGRNRPKRATCDASAPH